MPTPTPADAARQARFRSGLRAVAFGISSNALLIALKGAAGVLGHSQGLVADAVHSAADLANSIAAGASLLIARRPGDGQYPYGHGRAEALAATFAAFVVGSAGLLVGWDALRDLVAGHHQTPDWLTFWVALVALTVKLSLAVYAGRVARRTHSQAVNADARDHLPMWSPPPSSSPAFSWRVQGCRCSTRSLASSWPASSSTPRSRSSGRRLTN